MAMAIIAAALMALTTVPAMATQLTLQGVNHDYLSAAVDFDYSYDAAHNQGLVDIGITNTSTDNSRLTSFAFNLPSNITGLASFTGPSSWEGRINPDHINTPEAFGKFDVAGLSGESFGGGSAKYGIPVGQTFEFLFRFSGSDLASLTDLSFLGLDSYAKPRSNDELEPFIARFQKVGENGDMNDLAVPAPVPEPGTMVLLGFGALSLCIYSKRRGRAAGLA
jgi:hypothetical protein